MFNSQAPYSNNNDKNLLVFDISELAIVLKVFTNNRSSFT